MPTTADFTSGVTVCWKLPDLTGDTSADAAATNIRGRVPLLFAPGVPIPSGLPPGTRGLSILGTWPRTMFQLTKYPLDGQSQDLVVFLVIPNTVETESCRDILNFLLRSCEGDHSDDLFKAAPGKKLDYDKFCNTLQAADQFGISAVDDILKTVYGGDIREFGLSGAIDHAGSLLADDDSRKNMVGYLAGFFASQKQEPGSPEMKHFFKDHEALGIEVAWLMVRDP